MTFKNGQDKSSTSLSDSCSNHRSRTCYIRRVGTLCPPDSPHPSSKSSSCFANSTEPRRRQAAWSALTYQPTNFSWCNKSSVHVTLRNVETRRMVSKPTARSGQSHSAGVCAGSDTPSCWGSNRASGWDIGEVGGDLRARIPYHIDEFGVREERDQVGHVRQDDGLFWRIHARPGPSADSGSSRCRRAPSSWASRPSSRVRWCSSVRRSCAWPRASGSRKQARKNEYVVSELNFWISTLSYKIKDWRVFFEFWRSKSQKLRERTYFHDWFILIFFRFECLFLAFSHFEGQPRPLKSMNISWNLTNCASGWEIYRLVPQLTPFDFYSLRCRALTGGVHIWGCSKRKKFYQPFFCFLGKSTPDPFSELWSVKFITKSQSTRFWTKSPEIKAQWENFLRFTLSKNGYLRSTAYGLVNVE